MDAASATGKGIDGFARWSLRLFGDFQLSERAGGERVALPGKRERVLLAYLALSPNGRQPRRKLVTLLWGEAADETTLENLRTAIFNLRKALGDTEHQLVASEDRDIVLESSRFEVDVLEFRKLAAGSGTAELEAAAKLYAGDFLDGLSIESEEFESWRREEAMRCKSQALDALTRLMKQLAGSGESKRAIDVALRILRLEPLHEAAVRGLMRLYNESGQRATAVELYRTLADSLKKELGAQPEAETRAVYGDITRGGEVPTAATADVKSPLPSPTTARPSDTHSLPATEPAAPIARPPVNRRTVAWLAAGGLAAATVVSILLFGPFAPSTSPTSSGSSTVVAATPTSAIALAVLPFANLSTEQDQEFFSDGLTDEISSALAKVPDLRIVARTSAFEFKGQNRNIRMIGEQLGATHLIEGSVRRAGDRVRITVQLIRADDGTRVWSDDYDRQLTDIFAIQEEIARAIASSLRVPLGLENGQQLVTSRSVNSEDYQQFLRAKAMVRGRELMALTEATVLLEAVVARDQGFAPAWALLAQAYALIPVFHPASRYGSVDELRNVVDASLPRAETAAQRSITLDPNHADGYLSFGLVQDDRGKFQLAEELYAKALALDPTNPDGLHRKGLLLAEVGRVQEALAVMQQLRELEPFVPIYNANVASVMMLNGKDDEARALLAGLPPDTAVGRLAELHAAAGRYNEAIDALLTRREAYSAGTVEAAVRLLRSAPALTKGATQERPYLGLLGFVYLHVGEPERVLDFYDSNLAAGNLNAVATMQLWLPSRAPVRKTLHFKEVVRKAGLFDYWRAKGWPDLCRPVGADDFACE